MRTTKKPAIRTMRRLLPRTPPAKTTKNRNKTKPRTRKGEKREKTERKEEEQEEQEEGGGGVRKQENDLLGEALLLEIADGVIVCIGEIVAHLATSDLAHSLLELIHDGRAKALYLLARRDGTKDDLAKGALWKQAICDASDDGAWQSLLLAPVGA